jgi:RHS repeat-associated protein
VYNPYQYTGEAWDGEVELLYLRARYYQPEVGRFVTKDPWAGDFQRAGTLNLYVYSLNDPTNRVDPSGLIPSPRPPHAGPYDDRDLTDWLYEELQTQSRAPEVAQIHRLLSLSRVLGPYAGALPWASAALKWAGLVRDGARWDFKHRIRQEFRDDPVMLRQSGGVDYWRWYTSDVPGNIFFGYIGRAAGFFGFELHLGASFAEITDPAHKGEAICVIPVPPPWDPDQDETTIYLDREYWYTLFDAPRDFLAVEFGVIMYNRHGEGMSRGQFMSFLGSHGQMLSPVDEPADAGEYHNPRWPYYVGYFNGPEWFANTRRR